MRRPNRVADHLSPTAATALRAYRRILTGTADGRNAAAPKRVLSQAQRTADLREAATVKVETMRDAARDGGAA